MNIHTLCALILFSFSVQTVSKELSISVSYDQLKDTKLKSVKPQLFIFDQSSALIWHSKTLTRNLISFFEPSHELSSRQVIKNDVVTLLPESFDFGAFDYTLIFVTDADASEFCPPCVTQAKVNKAVIGQFDEDKVAYITIAEKIEGSRTFEMLSEDEFKSVSASLIKKG